MFKLYKNLSKKGWFGVVLIILLTILQVYLTITIVDFVQGIVQSITYLHYHNNPLELGTEFAGLVENFGWVELSKEEFLLSLGFSGEALTNILNIATASVGDIWYNGGMMMAISAGIMAVQTIISLIASAVSAGFATKIRSKVYKKVESFSLHQVNTFSTASLITRTTNDIQQIQMFSLMLMRMIFAAPITAIWAICKINASSSELTIATAIAIIILLISIMAIMLLVLPKFKITQKLTDDLNCVTRENLNGIKVVRAFNAEKFQENKFDNVNNNFTKTQIFVGKVMALLSPIMAIIMNGISLAMYWIGAHLINAGSIDYATVTSFMMLSSQIIMAFVTLLLLFVIWPRASVSAKRVNEVLDSKNLIDDPEILNETTLHGTVEFKDVSFKYQDGHENVISNLNFKVNENETLAIIGATGCGKTTLINLIPRFYDVTSGEVLVNGVNVKDLKQEDLRNLIGYVPQKAFLFKGTIKENIKLGQENITDEEIIQACKIAKAQEFIEEKDEKYDYEIAQSGKNVSGGQKQRLCIARAVAKQPEIYIFDDSFSALDYKTDKEVRDNLNNMPKKSTKIIIAQRIGTIMDADKIIVLDKGKMVGYGTHKELLNNCQVYKEIALSQLSKEEL